MFLLYFFYLTFVCYSMAEVCRLSDCIPDRLQETHSLCCTHRGYPGKTSCNPRRRHQNNSESIPPVQRLSGRSRRPQAGSGCALPTTGHWDGPGICIDRAGISARDHVPSWERFHVNALRRAAPSPCSGLTPVHTVCPARIPFGSSGSAAVRETVSRILGSEASRSRPCGGSKVRACFRGRGGNGGAPTSRFWWFYACNSDILCLRMCVAWWNKDKSTFNPFEHCFDTQYIGTVISIIAIITE